MRTSTTCPHLKEVVMLYCDSCSFKKMVALAHLASVSPCLAQDFKSCLLYKEVMARLSTTINEEPAPVRPTPVFEREVSTS